MSKLICLLVLVLFASTLHSQQNGNASQQSQSSSSAQQQNGNTPAAQLAHHIADKMKDSLGLSNQQRAKVFAINIDIYKEKAEKRSKSTDRNVIGAALQAVEASRNPRYKEVLTQEQYLRYLQKKTILITSK